MKAENLDIGKVANSRQTTKITDSRRDHLYYALFDFSAAKSSST
jgi:hypothetical protein